MILHPIPPVYDERSEILILGSFPSVLSRETGFFYGHPRNRFWRVLAAVFDASVPESIPEKRAFLLARRVALFDVIASCEITGSADSTIRDVTPNDLSPILASAGIRRIFTNGKTAFSCYRRYTEARVGRPAVCLPSTSPANAAMTEADLVRVWKRALLGDLAR